MEALLSFILSSPPHLLWMVHIWNRNLLFSGTQRGYLSPFNHISVSICFKTLSSQEHHNYFVHLGGRIEVFRFNLFSHCWQREGHVSFPVLCYARWFHSDSILPNGDGNDTSRLLMWTNHYCTPSNLKIHDILIGYE